ncbi:MAG TPA: penicillin-binding protein 1C [Burkholderiales bacterium]|nr:penicillin-binding protein 1C [Burkholderiales bacterium]
MVTHRAFWRRTGAAAAIAAAAFAASFFIAPYPVPSFESVKGSWHSSDAWLLDRNGVPLSKVRIDHERRRGEWVAAGDVSPALKAMVLASEDRRFEEHGGVDWAALPAALKQTVTGARRGGSTLTMQLAAYLNPELEASGRRNLLDKWRQMRQALAIERAWDKRQVLEAWLNLTPFRGELEGLDAASRALFGKTAQGLDRIESSLLAALVRSPNAAASRVAKRACGLLDRVEYDCLIAEGLASAGLRPGRLERELDGAASHLAHKLLKTPGERLKSTLDAPLQRFALSTLQRHIRELAGRNVEDGALVVLDNDSGEVLAWVGSSGELSSAREVDGVTAPRLAGSTLKPFLYSLAIEKRLLTAASVLDDSPLAVTLPTGLYVPQNYDHTFKGHVSLRQALASSLNVPAVRTLALTGYEAFYRRLKDLGFELPRDADHYGYSLALGGAEVTLLTLSNAYRALANGGRVAPVKSTPTLALPLRGREGSAVDPRAAYIVSDILADPAARAMTFGLASPLATRYRASVKTGTSKDMRDNWTVGYSGRYTVGVWVGNFSGAPMHDVSGIDGAAPIWREVMDYLHEGDAPAAPPVPEGVVRQRIHYTGNVEPDRDELFLAGTERAEVVTLARSVGAKIETPANGAIYAIDPDIPAARQRLVVSARGAPKNARFVFEDGREARADKPFMWLPPPGRRELVLKSADGKELDRVKFEVRGLRQRRNG